MKKVTMYIEDNVSDDQVQTHYSVQQLEQLTKINNISQNDTINRVKIFLQNLKNINDIIGFRIMEHNAIIVLEVRTNDDTLEIPLGTNDSSKASLNYSFNW